MHGQFNLTPGSQYGRVVPAGGSDFTQNGSRLVGSTDSQVFPRQNGPGFGTIGIGGNRSYQCLDCRVFVTFPLVQGGQFNQGGKMPFMADQHLLVECDRLLELSLLQRHGCEIVQCRGVAGCNFTRLFESVHGILFLAHSSVHQSQQHSGNRITGLPVDERGCRLLGFRPLLLFDKTDHQLDVGLSKSWIDVHGFFQRPDSRFLLASFLQADSKPHPGSRRIRFQGDHSLQEIDRLIRPSLVHEGIRQDVERQYIVALRGYQWPDRFLSFPETPLT